MKAVLAQIVPSLGDLDRNLEIHIDEIGRAVKKGADLIVFPELSLTGYLLKDLVPECAQDPATSPYIRRLAQASRRIAIVAGYVQQVPGFGFRNAAACFIGGRTAHVHHKVYLPTYGMFDEARYFGAGEIFRTFEAPWGRTGILICEDLWHLSSSYILAQEGMDLLIALSNGPTKGIDDSPRPASRETWLALGQAIARFFTCGVLYVNRAGYEDGWNYGGGSYALSPSGALVAEGRLFRPDRVAVNLDPADLRNARVACPILRDEKLDLVRRELERVAAARYGTE